MLPNPNTQGYLAAKARQPINTCPYHPGQWVFAQWLEGYRQGLREHPFNAEHPRLHPHDALHPPCPNYPDLLTPNAQFARPS